MELSRASFKSLETLIYLWQMSGGNIEASVLSVLDVNTAERELQRSRSQPVSPEKEQALKWHPFLRRVRLQIDFHGVQRLGDQGSGS